MVLTFFQHFGYNIPNPTTFLQNPEIYREKEINFRKSTQKIFIAPKNMSVFHMLKTKQSKKYKYASKCYVMYDP